MAIAPIETDEDLNRALERVDALWPRKGRSKKAADELKVLAILIEEYERRAATILPPTPLEAIRFRMDQLGLKTIKWPNTWVPAVLVPARCSMGNVN